MRIDPNLPAAETCDHFFKFFCTGIFDYIVKTNNRSVDSVISLIDRTYKNRLIKAIVIENSNAFRMYVSNILRRQLFHVIEVSTSSDALQAFKDNPDLYKLNMEHLSKKYGKSVSELEKMT